MGEGGGGGACWYCLCYMGDCVAVKYRLVMVCLLLNAVWVTLCCKVLQSGAWWVMVWCLVLLDAGRTAVFLLHPYLLQLDTGVSFL